MAKKKVKSAVKKTIPSKKKAASKTVAKKIAAKKTAPVKKSAPKKAAKRMTKTISPKGMEITITRKLLGKAPEERHFYLADGSRLGSIMELADALRGMNDDLFGHHVNEARNDFANWIHEVFEEPDFAQELRTLNDKVDTEIACLRRLIEELKSVKKEKR